MTDRLLEHSLRNRWDSGKTPVVVGTRQVGKTTLLRKLCDEAGNYLSLDADEADTRVQLENTSLARLRQIIGSHKTVFVDEAQRVRNIGLTLKLITDQLPGVRLLVSGSSSLDLANEINEPLTGRKFEFTMYPISWQELVSHQGFLTARQQLETRLLYGFYPDVITSVGDERAILQQLSSSRKVYFYDNGIRNAILADFKPLALRGDVGALWENFLVSERRKVLHYNGLWARSYFWRTHQQQEIDYLEEQDGELQAWEFKWSPLAKAHFPKPFVDTYAPVRTETIHRDNFEDFAGVKSA